MTPPNRWALPVAASVLLLLLAWAYWPGLAGPFLFDDYGNLDVLGAYGRIHGWRDLLFYATSGNADPTGRPIALLSFLLDARSWPADPWPFKRTNVALHLLNTGLLAWTLTRLQTAWSARKRENDNARWAPLVAAALWGVHPFFVSTTLYVVQREAMLPMTFVLLALLAWDRAVLCFVRQRNRVGWIWAVAGMGGATLLAGMSKANGFLAPLLVGLAYLYFLRPDQQPSAVQRRPMDIDIAAALCLGLPSLLALGYLLQVGLHLWLIPQLAGRDWTLPQRLLSEPRALWSYVWRMTLPRAGGGGIYVDDFEASHSWLDPISTLPAVLALAASIVGAVVWHRRFPIASFAWLFFLCGHLLESSTVPLELYFEHRNYLPAMFLGWPLAHGLLRRGTYERYRTIFTALLLCALLLLTHQRALIWGNPALLSVLSVEHQPNSDRSQVAAASEEFAQGNPQAALRRIEAAQRRDPTSVDVAISTIGMECRATGALAPRQLERVNETLANAEQWNYGLYQWLQDAVQDTNTRDCRGFGLAGVRALAIAAETNPRTKSVPGRLRDVWHVRGRIALAEGDSQSALRWFDAALRLKPDPDYALVQAAALGEGGAPALGVRHLDAFERLDANESSEPVRNMFTLHAWLLRRNGYYSRQISELRQQLQVEAARTSASSQTKPG